MQKGERLLLLRPEEIKCSGLIRRSFESEAMRGLVESVRRNGIIQPIVVRKTIERKIYELVSGSRRLQAATLLGLDTVPCIEVAADECQKQLISLLENLQRENLSFFEVADGISRLIEEFGFTQSQAAAQLGLAQSTVANKLRLLRLTPAQRESIVNVQLTERHARSLLRIADDALRTEVLGTVIVKGFTVEQTERYIDRLLTPERPERRCRLVVRDIRLFVNSIDRAIAVMKSSGVAAKSERLEDEECITYTVKIPKRRPERLREA